MIEAGNQVLRGLTGQATMLLRGGHTLIEEKQTLDNVEEIVVMGNATLVIDCRDLTCQPIAIQQVTVFGSGSFQISRQLSIANVSVSQGTLRIQQPVVINHLEWTGGTIECLAGQILRVETVKIGQQGPVRLLNCRLEVTSLITMDTLSLMEIRKASLTVTDSCQMLMYRKSTLTCDEGVLQNRGQLEVLIKQTYGRAGVTIGCPLVNEGSISVDNAILHVSESLRHTGSIDVQSSGSLSLSGVAILLPGSTANIMGELASLGGSFELGSFTGAIGQLTCQSTCNLKDGSATKISRLIVEEGRVNVDGSTAGVPIQFVDVKGQFVLNQDLHIEDLRLSGDIEVNGDITVTNFVWADGVVAGSGQMSVQGMDFRPGTLQEIRDAAFILEGPLSMDAYFFHSVRVSGTGSLRNAKGNVWNITGILELTGQQFINNGEIRIAGAESEIVMATSVINNGFIKVQDGARLDLTLDTDHYGGFEVSAGSVVSLSSFTAHPGSDVAVAESLDVDGDSAFVTDRFTVGSMVVKSGYVRVNVPSDLTTFSLPSLSVHGGSLLLQGLSERPFPLNTALVYGGILDIRQNCTIDNVDLESGTMYVLAKSTIQTFLFKGGAFTSGNRRVSVDIENMTVSGVGDKTIFMTAISITKTFHWADEAIFLDAIFFCLTMPS